MDLRGRIARWALRKDLGIAPGNETIRFARLRPSDQDGTAPASARMNAADRDVYQASL
jgi:hypothetical protein